MGRTRNEELHKIQDLGLIRDERDRELERTSRSRACSVLVTVSLLMAAACLLQGESAWAALLALTPLSWAVQNFSRFAADGKRLYLVLALLSGAAALGLAGWYLIQEQESGLFSIGRLIGFAVLSCLLISLAGLVFLALFLSAMFLKGRIGRMNGERWERWFRSVSTLGLLMRLGVLMAFAVLLVSIVSIPLFQFLGVPGPGAAGPGAAGGGTGLPAGEDEPGAGKAPPPSAEAEAYGLKKRPGHAARVRAVFFSCQGRGDRGGRRLFWTDRSPPGSGR